MSTETKKDTRKEYTLKAPEGAKEGEVLLIQDGEEKFAGDKIRMRPSQAERFKHLIA